MTVLIAQLGQAPAECRADQCIVIFIETEMAKIEKVGYPDR
jgi:hypothetical protein